MFAQKTGTQDAGYEYIPPAFKPLVLPTTLRTIRGIIFGQQPDQRFLNLRARELLSYIHQTELAEYLYALDSRVTYWPEPDTSVFNYAAGVTVRQNHGPTTDFAVGGEFIASNSAGKAAQTFLVRLGNTAFEGLHVAVIPVSSERQTTYTSITDTTAIPAVGVPETQIKIRIGRFAHPTPVGNPRLAEWVLKTAANPQPAITTLMPTLELLGEPIFLDLFGVAPTEPYATFRNVWFDHPLPAYRLAGLILAYIYRAEEIRQNKNV